MSRFKVVTPKGASFTVAGGGYDYEKEALDPIGAEIVEAPANEAEFIAAAKTADAIYAKGMPITKAVIDALENCKVITLGSVGVDSVDVKAATARGIPVTNVPDTFIEEVADHAMTLAARGLPPPDRAGQDGARGTLERGPAGAAENPAPDGADARLRLVRSRGARGGETRGAVRFADDGLRSLHPGNADVRSRRDAGDAVGGAVAIRLRVDACAGPPRGASLAGRKAFQTDEKERGLRQHRARRHRGRGSA